MSSEIENTTRREVEELTATIGLMAAFVGAQFVPDQRKTETFIAARERRQSQSDKGQRWPITSLLPAS